MVETAVPQGFKQTEAGVIPEDWEVKKLRDCLIQKPDYGINAAAIPYNEALPVYLRITDITDDGKYSTKNIVSVDNVSSEAFYLQKGDLVFARTGASVGKTYLYNPSDGELVFAGFLIRIKTRPEILLPEYFQFYTQTSLYWQWIRTNSLRTGQPGINGNEYGELPVSLPPKAEQAAIATALSDIDALIAGLEKLLAKKRAIKQAAMQELLRPKEGWEVKKLGEVLKVHHGKSQHEVRDDNGTYPILASGGIIGKARFYLYNKPSVLIGRKGTIDVPQYMDKPFWTIDTLFYTELFDSYDAKFVFYMFNLIDWYAYNEGSGVPSLNAKTIEKIELAFPGNRNEQTAIARILTDMDTEIEALEKKLSKYQMLKQGMMQTLLTGKVRLV